MRHERDLTRACGDAPTSSARVFSVGDDRRRGLVLRAGDHLELLVDPGEAEQLRFAAAALGKSDQMDLRIALGEGEDAAVRTERVEKAKGWISGEIAVPAGATNPMRVSIDVSAPRRRARNARLVLATPRLVEPPADRPGGARNVLVYLIDTLRADHTSVYGYGRDTTPRLAALARDGVVFERAYSTAARTRPATASLLTGLFPSRHNARLGRGLSADVETLAERLRDGGWSTWAFIANGNVFAHGLEFEQGFDRFYAVRGGRLDNHARSEDINEVLFPHLREHRDEPFFLYVHAIDPHSPYDAPPEWQVFRDPAYTGKVVPAETKSRILGKAGLDERDVQHVRDLYDEDVHYQDAMLGALLDELDRLGELDDTLVIVVADHGEEFHDHGAWEHGNRLYEEQIHVPLVVRIPHAPDLAGRRIAAPISIVDVMPTLLAWYGLPPVAESQGHDVSALLDERPAASESPAPRPIYAEEKQGPPAGDLRTLLSGRWKLIRRSEGPLDDATTKYELFDLTADPDEKSNRSDAEAEHADVLRKRLATWTQHTPSEAIARPTVEIDEETRRQLQALGYAVDEGDRLE